MEMERYGCLKSTRAGEDRNWWSPQESTRQVAVLYTSGVGEDGLRPDETSALSGRFIQKLSRKDTLLR
jgi:hypothetical protein